jgi:hypothetical protein
VRQRHRIQSHRPDARAGERERGWERERERGFAESIVIVLVVVLALLVIGLVLNPFAVALAGGIALGVAVLAGVALVARQLLRRQRPPDTPLDTGRLRRSLDESVAIGRTKLSAPALSKVQSIRRTVLEILPRVDAMTDDVESLYLVEQTVLDFLPTALASYLELPREYATTEVIGDGKTAQEILLEQLTLLDDTMRDIASGLNRQGSDRLVAHGRFLEDRFRRDRYLAHAHFLDERLRRSRDLEIAPPDDVEQPDEPPPPGAPADQPAPPGAPD